jgi:hypothetical protein
MKTRPPPLLDVPGIAARAAEPPFTASSSEF